MTRALKLSCLTAVLLLFVSLPAVIAQLPSNFAKFKDEMRMPWQRETVGYIQRWLILGVFPNPDRKGFDIDYLSDQGGEAKIRPVPGMTHKRPDGSQVAWAEYSSDSATIDFLKAFQGRPTSEVVAYAYTTIERPAAGKALLSLGSDDGVAVWLNGERVHRNPVTRGLSPDEDQVEVNMVAGTNYLLIKVDQGTGGWGFSVRLLNTGSVTRTPQLAATLESGDADTLVLASNPAEAAGPVKFEVMAAGGKVQAEKTEPRGTRVTFATATWAKGAYDVRVTSYNWLGRRERVFVPWYKGDALQALKNLVAKAPKSITSAEAGHHAMLAEMVMDRTKGKLESPGSAVLPTLYSILMEFEELQQQKHKAGLGPVHASGFVRLSYQDEIDGSTQFCRAYLPGSYDASRKWPLVVSLHGYNPDNPVYVRWWSVDVRHNALAENHDIIFVEPHGRGNTSYHGIGDRDVMRCIALAKETFRVDDDRVYLNGFSMGGGGTWSVASRHPEMFAAIAPVFGGWDYHVLLPEERLAKLSPRERYVLEAQSTFVQAESLLNLPIFVNHGDADQSVNVDFSRYVVRMLQRWGYNIRYREHVGKGHTDLGNNDEVIDWLLQHKRNPNPPRVRVRAAELSSASAYWVKVEQRADQRDFMVAEAEIWGANSIRLDTKNVVAVTLSPSSPLVDPAKPLRISWNGATAQSVMLKNGRLTLYAEGYTAPALAKSPLRAGPMGDVTRTPFAVVVGTIAEDNMTRELCARKAKALADFWSNWQHQPLRMYKDTEIPESDLAKYSLVLIGGPEANAVTKKLGDALPLRISGGEIAVAGRTFKAPDAAVMMVYPHPLNPERYVLVAAASSPAGMYFVDLLNEDLSRFDFVVMDGTVINSSRGRTADKVRIAAGLLDSNWRITEPLLDEGDAQIRAKSPALKVRPDLTIVLAGVPEIRPEVYAAYVGEYQTSQVRFSVAKEGDRLVAHVPHQSPVALIPETETDFTAEGADIGVTFVRDSSGKVTHASVQMPYQTPITARKMR